MVGKQSVKQLGLSYGIITKQDVHNKLVPSKKNKGKDQSPKKNHRKHGGLVAYKVPAGGIYHLDHSAMISDMLCEGNQITYDEQNNLMVKTSYDSGSLRKSTTN